MNLTEICLKRPVLAWMLMAGTVLLGVLAVMRIGVSQYPDVDNPTVSVSVTWAGASAEDVETGVLNPIEDAMSQVTGVESLTASARQGSARLTATFDLSRDIDLALQDTQAKIAQVQRKLPTGVDPPTVSKSNPDDQPILTIGVSGPFSRQLLADVARYQLSDRLQTVPGVGQVSMMGYLDRNVRIWVDAHKLVATGVTVSDVLSALKREHVSAAGGELDTGGRALSVRIAGEATDLETLRHIVVRTVGDHDVRLGDVALVQDGFADKTSIARSNGTPVQALGVLKQPGSNAVAVAKSVHEAIDEVQKTLPAGMRVEVLFDTTQFIQESVSEIALELVLAVILTALVCWLFLGSISSTLNVLFAIPMSLLGTIAVIYFAGFTLNTFTLLGLSLAVGLVVDDAVMVMENIFRHAEMGKDRIRAAAEGTREITFAALAATVAVIAIFLPVAFMSGVVGRFFLQFGVTLSVAVGISYLEAITLAPARCAQMLKAGGERTGLGHKVDLAFEKLSHAYERGLSRALAHPWLVILVGALVLGSAVGAAAMLKQEFVPSQDQSRLGVRISTTIGANLDETDRLVKKVEAFLAKRPEVERTLTTLGSGGTNSASLSLTLVPPNQRQLSQAEFAAVLRKEMAKIPGLRGSVQDLSQQSFGGSRGGYPVDFSVRGSDWPTLVKFASSLREELASSGMVVDVDTDYQLGAPELVVEPDRARAADVGVDVEDIANTVSALFGGETVGQYSTGGRRMDMRLRLLASQRTRPEDLQLVQVRTSGGKLVPLSTVVKTHEQPQLQSINHADRERAIRVYGNVAPGHSQGEAIAYVQQLAAKAPTGYSVVLGGQSSQLGDSMTSLLFALVIGILFAYMVLASQFNSFLHPVTVLTILPLSVAGAMFALLIAGKSLNVFSMIGLLLLMGIVKKNSIILVDCANAFRAEGLGALEAMKRAGPVRLRPILMTAVATLMAAVPSALGFGPGSETRAPMADAVIGGLIVSTALSLFVVPAFYLLADRMKQRFASKPEAPPKPEAMLDVPPAA